MLSLTKYILNASRVPFKAASFPGVGRVAYRAEGREEQENLAV